MQLGQAIAGMAAGFADSVCLTLCWAQNCGLGPAKADELKPKVRASTELNPTAFLLKRIVFMMMSVEVDLILMMAARDEWPCTRLYAPPSRFPRADLAENCA
ncbi:MAG TPA: hypothetical protein VIO16_07225 [Dehalococcoidia bacterium]